MAKSRTLKIKLTEKPPTILVPLKPQEIIIRIGVAAYHRINPIPYENKFNLSWLKKYANEGKKN
jgi:hypothetical protein